MTRAPASDSPEAGLTLRMERRFAASRQAVFDAWSNAKALRQWMGPKGVEVPEAEVDFRIGGNFRFPMLGDDGSRNCAFGRYLEIRPAERLVFTWAWEQEDGSAGVEMRITLEFLDDPKGCLLRLSQERLPDGNARDKHQGGWSSCFDCLAKFLGS